VYLSANNKLLEVISNKNKMNGLEAKGLKHILLK